jgi:hypothetical protein
MGSQMPRSTLESHRTNRYFVILAVVLLGVVIAGFGRTFFFRSVFRVPPLYWYLYLHGAVQAAWVALFATQTFLIARGRIHIHRRLGMVGAALSLLVVGLGAFALLNLSAHFKSGHLSNDTRFDFQSIVFVFWQDWADLLTFAVFVSLGLALRGDPPSHKRLMLLATIRIVGAALVRAAGVLGHWLPPLATQQAQVLFTTLVLAVLFPLTLIAHDLISLGRVHRATLAGVAFNILTGMAAGAIATSTWGRAIFKALA